MGGKNDPTYVGVQFPGSATFQEVPVEALKILPNGQIQNNMTGNAGRDQYTPEQLAAMRANTGGISTGMILCFGLLAVILIFSVLAGLYLFLGEEEVEGRDSFVDLEAGRRRRPQKSELGFAKRVRRKTRRRDRKAYLSGRELERAASRRHRSRRHLSAAPRAKRRRAGE